MEWASSRRKRRLIKAGGGGGGSSSQVVDPPKPRYLLNRGELRAMCRVPQVLENVRVRERIPLTAMPQVEQVIASVQRRLDGDGRLLVRYSGTEMLARVMVEGEDQSEIKALAEEIGAAIRKHAGVA